MINMNKDKLNSHKDSVVNKANDIKAKVEKEMKSDRNPTIFGAIIAVVTIVSAAATLRNYLKNKNVDKDL